MELSHRNPGLVGQAGSGTPSSAQREVRADANAELGREVVSITVHGLQRLLTSPRKCCFTSAMGRMRILQVSKVLNSLT